jgi:hypothetical protein
MKVQKVKGLSACEHTPGFNEGYIYNCPFCGEVNPKLEGKSALIYSDLKRNGDSEN